MILSESVAGIFEVADISEHRLSFSMGSFFIIFTYKVVINY